MAFNLSRLLCLQRGNITRYINSTISENTRSLSTSATNFIVEHHSQQVIADEAGISKDQLTEGRAANDNPFDTYVIRPEADTGIFAKKPILIPSMNDSRIVGCCCEADYKEIVWFKLNAKDGVQRCDCGYYFVNNDEYNYYSCHQFVCYNFFNCLVHKFMDTFVF